jgi:SulP family sulfate permease
MGEGNFLSVSNEASTAPKSGLSRFLPGLRLFREYRREWFPSDLIAGLSVSFVVIPAAIAYATLMGLPPQYGLFAPLAPLLVYPFFGSSRQFIVGPDIAITLLVASAIIPLSAGDPTRAPALAAMVALLAGIFLLLGAAAGLGAVADLLSKPVLAGYMTGAALILIGSQIDKLMGVHLVHTNFFPRLVELAGQVRRTHPPTLLLGLCLLTVIPALKKFAPKIPPSLVVVMLGLAASICLNLPARGVAVVGSFAHGLPTFTLPSAGWADVHSLLSAAIGIALLVYTEGILLARAFAVQNSYEVNSNQELVALGAANVFAGLFQGFAVTGSQSSTVVNDAAGGKTQVTSLVAAGALILFILFLAPWMEKLPTVALAAILLFGACRLLEFKTMVRIYKYAPRGGIIAGITTLGVLAGGVTTGIMIGVILSLVGLINRISRPPDAVLSEIPGHGFHDVGNHPAETLPGLVVFRFYAPLLFSNAGYFTERVQHVIAGAPHPVRWFLLDAQAITDLDVTAADALTTLQKGFVANHISLKIVHANRPFREVIERNGLLEELGPQSLFDSVHECVQAFQALPAQ